MRRTHLLQILMVGCQEESTSSAKSTLIWSFLGEAGKATNTSEYNFSFKRNELMNYLIQYVYDSTLVTSEFHEKLIRRKPLLQRITTLNREI